MRLIEGRGYLVRCALDTPFMGWIGARQLDTLLPFGSAPWMALRALSELTLLFPGGLALLWDLPQ
ncbi:MAG TPA: hypothetical protein VN436_03960, partial [Holophaga sp.]|nr:hypothetical protein [Holophaga sp.]